MKKMLWGLLTGGALVACAAAADVASNYPMTDVNRMLADECARRSIAIVDYHVHLRGGMTPEKAVARGIALEIQAESPYPRPKFLRLAKQMGAKFSFGTNNFDARPKDLTHWLDAITWLDLHGSDIWMPQDLK